MAQKLRRGFLQDLRSLHLSIEESTGGQATIDSSSGFTVTVLITPNDGINAHATFSVKLSAPNNYPKVSPDVTFCTPIFHPNISNDMGDVCLSMLNSWNSCYSLLDVVKGIIFLIKNPNFDSANNSFGYLLDSLRHCLADVSHQLLAGYPVRGVSYKPNKSWCTWARANGCFPSPLSIQTSTADSVLNSSSADENSLVDDLMTSDLDAFDENLYSFDDTIITKSSSRDSNSICATSTYIPSVANVRYSVGSLQSSFGSRYEKTYMKYFETQRIILTPSDEPTDQLPFVFYYCEYIGSNCLRSDLGVAYFRLFSGSLTDDDQLNNGQISSFLPWFLYCHDFRYVSYKQACDSNSVCLSNLSSLFNEVSYLEPQTDLCSGCGFYLLNSLFAERVRPRPSSVEFSSLHLDDLFGGRLSSTEPSSLHLDDVLDSTDVTNCLHPPPSVSLSSLETELSDDLFVSESLPCTCSARSSSEVLQQQNPHSDVQNELYPVPSLEENRFHCCPDCSFSYRRYSWKLHDFLPSCWVFYQTRWPPTLAPQQWIDLSLNSETRVPPWRGSVNRLAFDMKGFIQRFPSTQFLLLLDPLAISPWSPIVNLLTVKKMTSAPRDHWQSVLWMTPAMAISSHTAVSESVFPSSFGLRLISVVALLSNWVAWFSRLETYSSMGYSRFVLACIANPLATSVLSPASLGCGQTPLLDLWPLWSGRILFRSFCTLFTFCANRLSPLRIKHHELRCLFPFSDTDEL